MKEELWTKVKWMKKNVMLDFLLSMSVSFFGLILIFGLGFVFPEINPYVAIKWIVIVCAIIFAYALITFLVLKVITIKAKMAERKTLVKVKKTSKK